MDKYLLIFMEYNNGNVYQHILGRSESEDKLKNILLSHIPEISARYPDLRHSEQTETAFELHDFNYDNYVIIAIISEKTWNCI